MKFKPFKKIFAITDEVVVINSVPYKIHDNTIPYNGETYKVEENYTLSKYDENGKKIIYILPVEQNRVPDLSPDYTYCISLLKIWWITNETEAISCI